MDDIPHPFVLIVLTIIWLLTLFLCHAYYRIKEQQEKIEKYEKIIDRE